jgi:tetratricopeptide (TPR) repeat protein
LSRIVRRHPIALRCSVLIACVLAIYARVASHEFIDYDTPDYLTRNPVVAGGLSWPSVEWAFTTFHAANWHPITWLSHMLDVQLFGQRPGPMHLVNVAWHAANACLVYLVLRRMTRNDGASFFVALLFAVHPLHVESVAWIVERKDLLCAFFGLSCLWFWTDWARERRRSSFAAALACYALGLMSKPMIVTWPCVMLLFDAWPLERTALGIRRLVVEKLPFFALALASSAITVVAQRGAGAVKSLGAVPFWLRLANSTESYVDYLEKTVWPTGLTFFYPFSLATIGTVRLVSSAAVLVAISAVAIRFRRRAPWVIVGWLFYLVTLLPVIGLVQVGDQTHADRYTYLPLLGVFLAIAWSLVRWIEMRAPGAKPARAAAVRLVRAVAAIAIASLGFVAAQQTSVWADAETLARHALDVDEHNHVAHVLLGGRRLERGEWEQAEREFRAALELRPDAVAPLADLGNVLERTGRLEEAEHAYRAVLQRKPDAFDVLADLGNVLYAEGRVADAETAYRSALQRAPGNADLHRNVALCAWARGDRSEALSELDAALRIAPSFTRAHLARGQILEEMGREDEARAAVARALEIDPGYGAAHATLATFLSRRGDIDQAALEIDRAIAASPLDADFRRQASQLFLARGRAADALAAAREALRLRPSWRLAASDVVWILATADDPRVRDAKAAIAFGEAVIATSEGRGAVMFDALAAAYASDAQFDRAAALARDALSAAEHDADRPSAEGMARRLAAYREHRVDRASPR